MRSSRARVVELCWRETSRKGVAYLAVLPLVLIVSLTGLGFLQLTELGTHEREEAVRLAQAEEAARAALARIAWALRRLPLIQPFSQEDLNPFHRNYYGSQSQSKRVVPLISLLNPQPGQAFYPNKVPGAYYLIGDLRASASGTKVRAGVLGSVDVDGDGLGGIGDHDQDGHPDLLDRDPDDTNFPLEAHLGLPGSLGKDRALSARDIVDFEGRQVGLQRGSVSLLLGKGIAPEGFLYDVTTGINSYGTLVAGEVGIGSTVLPWELFNDQGVPREAYFQGLPLKRLEGDQEFRSVPDPTSGSVEGGVIWVQGDLTIREVDLDRDWSRSDLVIAVTGKATLVGVECGWKGRLVLVAKEIEVRGRHGKWLNGVLVASSDVRLGSQDVVSKPVQCLGNVPCDAIYFFGSLLAGGDLRIESPGWAVVFDPLVLNGVMGLSPLPVLLDRFEGEALGSWWSRSGGEMAQGSYLEEERDNKAGDSHDRGGDGVPQNMRFTIRPSPDDPGIGQEIRLLMEDCSTCTADWRPYGFLQLWMAQDNYSTSIQVAPGVTVSVEREAHFKLALKDAWGASIEYQLNLGESPDATQAKYLRAEWGKEPYRIQGGDVADPDPGQDDYADGVLPKWKRLRILLSDFQGDVAQFGFQSVSELAVGLGAWEIRWIRREEAPGLESRRKLSGGSNRILFDPDGDGPREPVPTTADGEVLRWMDPDSGQYLDVPCGGPGDCWGLQPIKQSELPITLRLDRLELPGATNMSYGLPSAFCLESSFWLELKEQDLGR